MDKIIGGEIIMNQEIESVGAFVAVITPRFIELKEKKMKECIAMAEQNKPMYAIVKNGTKWKEFEPLPWRHVYFFSNYNRLNNIIDEIRLDLSFYRKTQEFGKKDE